MDMDDQKFNTVTHDGHVTAVWQGKGVREVGTASADRMPDSSWWLSRALVQPEEKRGQGIGSVLVMRLQHEVQAQGGTRLVVCPGGYGMDQKRQCAFYIRCGFREEPGDLGHIYVWSPNHI